MTKCENKLVRDKPNLASPTAVVEFDFPLEQDGRLSEEEEKINKYLDCLPEYVLTHDRTPIWKVRTLEMIGCAGFITSILGIPMLVANFCAKLSLPISASFVLAFVAVVVSLASGRSWFIKKENKMKSSITVQSAVDLREDLLKEAIIHTSSPFLKGRLAELLHLVKNPNIDYRFWVNLDNRLKPYIKNQTNRLMSSDTLDQIRAQYRHRVSHTP